MSIFHIVSAAMVIGMLAAVPVLLSTAGRRGRAATVLALVGIAAAMPRELLQMGWGLWIHPRVHDVVILGVPVPDHVASLAMTSVLSIAGMGLILLAVVVGRAQPVLPRR